MKYSNRKSHEASCSDHLAKSPLIRVVEALRLPEEPTKVSLCYRMWQRESLAALGRGVSSGVRHCTTASSAPHTPFVDPRLQNIFHDANIRQLGFLRHWLVGRRARREECAHVDAEHIARGLKGLIGRLGELAEERSAASPWM